MSNEILTRMREKIPGEPCGVSNANFIIAKNNALAQSVEVRLHDNLRHKKDKD